MMKALLLFSTLAIGALAGQQRFDKHKVFRVVPEKEDQLKVLQKLWKRDEFIFWSHPTTLETGIDVLVPPKNESNFVRIMKKVGLKSKVIVKDLQKLMDKEKKTIRRNHEKGMNWENYHTMEEIYSWMHQLAKKHRVVKEVTIGKTYEGRAIKLLDIIFDYGNPTLFIEAGMHGREWITTAASTYAVNKILESPKASIYRSFNYVLLPIANPDGYVYTWTHDRFWRKTRHPYHSGIEKCYGVDLIFNFDNKLQRGLPYSNPCSEFYSGPRPFSEPESKALFTYLKKKYKRKKIDLYLSLHSYGATITFPYHYPHGHRRTIGLWRRVALLAAKDFKAVAGNELTVSDSIPYGPHLDSLYTKMNTTLMYYFILRDKGSFGFLLPPYEIKPSGKELLAAVHRFLNEYLNLPSKY